MSDLSKFRVCGVVFREISWRSISCVMFYVNLGFLGLVGCIVGWRNVVSPLVAGVSTLSIERETEKSRFAVVMIYNCLFSVYGY